MNEVQHMSIGTGVPVPRGIGSVFERGDGGFETLQKAVGDQTI
jgi:hypothetical protein